MNVEIVVRQGANQSECQVIGGVQIQVPASPQGVLLPGIADQHLRFSIIFRHLGPDRHRERLIRIELSKTALGVNAIVLPIKKRRFSTDTVDEIY